MVDRRPYELGRGSGLPVLKQAEQQRILRMGYQQARGAASSYSNEPGIGGQLHSIARGLKAKLDAGRVDGR